MSDDKFWRALNLAITTSALIHVRHEHPELIDWVEQRVAAAQAECDAP